MIYHIDMANHYDQKNYSVLAMVSVNGNNKKDNDISKGIVITDPIRTVILKKYLMQNYTQL